MFSFGKKLLTKLKSFMQTEASSNAMLAKGKATV
nr:MAG TPA: hypothetical protein [Caudoviricetes sp.]